MKMLKRKILGPVTLLHLIVLGTSIAVVSGATMLYYEWSIDLTFSAEPLTFYRWSDGSTAGNIELSYNYYRDVFTVDDNATWGIWNRLPSTNKTAYLWAFYPESPLEIDYFHVKVLDESGTMMTMWVTTDWTNRGESNAVSWNATADTKYTLEIRLRGSSGASGFTEDIGLYLKTDP